MDTDWTMGSAFAALSKSWLEIARVHPRALGNEGDVGDRPIAFPGLWQRVPSSAGDRSYTRTKQD